MTQYSAGDGRSAASKFGQMIGEAFEQAVLESLRTYLSQAHSDYEILESDQAGNLVKLDMLGGSSRQLDTIIALRESDDPVALLESKWLKDARHHNDKGAWILQLREVSKKYPTIRGAVAILAGYWTEGVGVMLMSEGGIQMIWVASDDEVYQTLQPYIDNCLGENTFKLDPAEMRKRYPRPWDLANCLLPLYESGELQNIANQWLQFERKPDIVGMDLLKQSIDKLLAPLPENPAIKRFEIALHLDTGNTIYEELTDIESAIEFIQKYFQDSQATLGKITPKKRKSPGDSTT